MIANSISSGRQIQSFSCKTEIVRKRKRRNVKGACASNLVSTSYHSVRFLSEMKIVRWLLIFPANLSYLQGYGIFVARIRQGCMPLDRDIL